MTSRNAPREEDSVHFSVREDYPHDGSTAPESKTIDTDEDAERFCAYRNHRYGQSPATARAVLLESSQARSEGFPGSSQLVVDCEPLGITRPGAQNADRHDPDVHHADRRLVSVSPRSTTNAQGTSGFKTGGSEQVSPQQSGPHLFEQVSTNVNRPGHEDDDTDVTLGWEIEFLVPLAKGPVPGDVLQDGRYFIPAEDRDEFGLTLAEGLPAREHIARLLREGGGIPAAHTEPEALGAGGDDYAVWRVVPELDCTVHGVGQDLDHVGLELSSRVLPAGGEAGLDELRRVLSLLRGNVLVSLTKSCGLHVHIGASALNLNGQRHFVCLYVAIESVLFSLLHPSRRGNTYCSPVYDNSRFASEADAALGRRHGGLDGAEGSGDVPDRMRAKMLLMFDSIHSRDTDQIRRGILSKFGVRNALNMKVVQGGQGKYTFEFRHFQGSLDFAVIRQWTRVCLALVKTARKLEGCMQQPASEVYDAFYRVHCLPEGEGWKSLLELLGLEDAVPFWEQMRSSYPPPREGGVDMHSDFMEIQQSARSYMPRVD